MAGLHFAHHVAAICPGFELEQLTLVGESSCDGIPADAQHDAISFFASGTADPRGLVVTQSGVSVAYSLKTDIAGEAYKEPPAAKC